MIYLASDHAGFELKEKIKNWLTKWNFAFEDLGAFTLDPQDDYPDFISKAAQKVAEDPENSRALIFGGSGQGEAIVANRYKGVRAVVYYGAAVHPQVDIDGKRLDVIMSTRIHNNANILSLGARFLVEDDAEQTIKLWLNTSFGGDERHVRRINKIDAR